MATDPRIDIDEYLKPIPGANPSGESLAYEPEYDELREARRSEDDTLQGDWQRKAKAADWEQVVELGSGLIRERSKDLQIAAWIAEAVARRYGFAGLRDGLKLVRAIHETFWETYYPEIDDGDVESRFGPFIFLDSTLPALVRQVRLTAGFGEDQYSFNRWKESRATDNAGLRNPELMETLIAEGKITSKQFDDAVAQTPRRFYETLADDLKECLEAYKALDTSLDEKFGRSAPGLVNVRKALDDCRMVVEPILKAKRQNEPLPEDAPPPEEEPAAGDEPADDGAGADYGAEDEARPAAPRRRAGVGARSSGGPIGSVADAHQRIVEAAAYLRENDPSSAVPFLVVRALRMGELYGPSGLSEQALGDAPSSEVRMALKRLAAEGEWNALLEQAEQALGRPEGRAWLDAQRFALSAMAAGDVDRGAAASACRSLLRACLADFPELPDAELGDGTPTANAETRHWIRDEVRASGNGESADAPAPLEPMGETAPNAVADGPPDPWTTATELARSGRTAEAIDLIRRAMSAATTGRERFLRKLQLAELCVSADRHHVALPLSEDLARQVDEFRLEAWESEQLCARVWAAFYRCLRGCAAGNGSAERAQQVFARLCRLDVNQALTFGAEGPKG